ncbi:unnamed protein product [Polarella glacialis]|nr:unnamed protein product [Polarella glacialis]
MAGALVLLALLHALGGLVACASAACVAAGSVADKSACPAEAEDAASLLQTRPQEGSLVREIGTERRANATRACELGDHVRCAYSGTMCAGDQCCPGTLETGGKTYPCPSASEAYTGCEVEEKPASCFASLRVGACPCRPGLRFNDCCRSGSSRLEPGIDCWGKPFTVQEGKDCYAYSEACKILAKTAKKTFLCCKTGGQTCFGTNNNIFKGDVCTVSTGAPCGSPSPTPTPSPMQL